MPASSLTDAMQWAGKASLTQNHNIRVVQTVVLGKRWFCPLAESKGF